MFDIFGLGKYIKATTSLISPRTKAIQEFINEHNITSYVILDDFDMSNVFDYHFIYVRNYFNEQDFKKRITHYSSKKGSLHLKKFIFTILTICNMMLIFYFSNQNAEQSTQTSAWFLQFYLFQCTSFVS